MRPDPDHFWNPYLAGIALGLVLLSAFLVMGRGLGASGAALRIAVAALKSVAPDHVATVGPLARSARSEHQLWLVFEIFGVSLGGGLSAWSAGRLRTGVERGPTIGVPSRLVLALVGGVVMGVGARMARGCTSGQALTGGALLSVGSWAFMLSVFGGGYALARVVRREWR